MVVKILGCLMSTTPQIVLDGNDTMMLKIKNVPSERISLHTNCFIVLRESQTTSHKLINFTCGFTLKRAFFPPTTGLATIEKLANISFNHLFYSYPIRDISEKFSLM